MAKCVLTVLYNTIVMQVYKDVLKKAYFILKQSKKPEFEIILCFCRAIKLGKNIVNILIIK